MKHSPLKRRRKAPLYDPDREAMREWKRGVHVCALCTRSQANGVIVDCHHIVPQRVLRRWVDARIHEGVYDASERPLLLRKLLWDRRGRLALCRPHHDAVETRKRVLTRDEVPAEAWEFAGELGLTWWLERFTTGGGRMTIYCDACWTELPDGPPCECTRPEGYDSVVDRLMAEGYDRDEAEWRATAILEDDAA